MTTFSGTISLALGLAFAPATFAQVTIEPIDGAPNRIEGALKSTTGGRPKLNPNALVQKTDMVFPHIATGGGWETVMVFVNIGSAGLDFKQHFYDDYGQPMPVTLRTYPDGKIITTSGIQGHLPVGASFNFALFDATLNTQVGWASLEYDSTKGRLGGYAAFRLKAGGVINEGLVPLSAYDDSSFMMPFDNLEGFATGVAFANPASNYVNHVQITALDLNGNEIARDVVTIPPSGHYAYVLADRMPTLAGRAGTLLVESDLNRLSGIGIRMNIAGGGTFTSIPIMNWIPGV